MKFSLYFISSHIRKIFFFLKSINNFEMGSMSIPHKAFWPIESLDDGIVIFFSNEHPQKAYFPIEVTDNGIDTCVNNEHL